MNGNLKVRIIFIIINCGRFCNGRNIIERVEMLGEASRVIGGEPITNDIIGIPYQVSIQNTFGEHVCGGSIISSEWILTAAHCLDWPIEYLKVIVGTLNWTQPFMEYKVVQAELHCLFNKPLYHNDIGLLRLNESIVSSERVQIIQLAKENTLKVGDKLLLTGWGSTKPWSKYPDVLHKAQLKYISHSECAAIIRNVAWLSKGHICTDTTSGVGSCNGDSGSPLIDQKTHLQVGIVNFGEPCAVGYPDAFASVSYYYKWIQNAMNGINKC